MRATGGTTGRRPFTRSGTPTASATSRTAENPGCGGGVGEGSTAGPRDHLDRRRGRAGGRRRARRGAGARRRGHRGRRGRGNGRGRRGGVASASARRGGGAATGRRARRRERPGRAPPAAAAAPASRRCGSVSFSSTLGGWPGRPGETKLASHGEADLGAVGRGRETPGPDREQEALGPGRFAAADAGLGHRAVREQGHVRDHARGPLLPGREPRRGALAHLGDAVGPGHLRQLQREGDGDRHPHADRAAVHLRDLVLPLPRGGERGLVERRHAAHDVGGGHLALLVDDQLEDDDARAARASALPAGRRGRRTWCAWGRERRCPRSSAPRRGPARRGRGRGRRSGPGAAARLIRPV